MRSANRFCATFLYTFLAFAYQDLQFLHFKICNWSLLLFFCMVSTDHPLILITTKSQIVFCCLQEKSLYNMSYIGYLVFHEPHDILIVCISQGWDGNSYMMQQHLQGRTDSSCYEPIDEQRSFQKKTKTNQPFINSSTNKSSKLHFIW